MNRKSYIEDFITKLHERDYLVDPKANDIVYGKNLSISDAISNSISEYNTAATLGVPDPILPTSYVFSVITSAFAHGVIIERSDLKKQLRETENMLTQYESDKRKIQKDRDELFQKTYPLS